MGSQGARPGIFAGPNSIRTWRQNAALAAFLALVAMLLLPPEASFAGVGMSATPDFPTTVQVGQTRNGSLTLVNNSNNEEAVGSITVTEIRMVPSCSNLSMGCLTGTADPDTFTLSATGTGEPGTACEGQTFTITEVNPATGEVEFTPTSGDVVLQQPSGANDLDTCQINFTFTVNKVPNHDASAAPGVQTNQVASAFAVHDLTGLEGTGTGTDQTTVQQAAPAIVTQATPTGNVGEPITDVATLSGGAGPAPGPTGTITFELFGPDDATCAGPAIFTDTAAVAGNGDYTSDPFTPTAPGTYQWVVTYSGDANNAPATSPCGAPNEVTVVSEAAPAIVTQASGPVTLGNPVSDTATLSGGFNPTGTITFTAFGPDDPTCAGVPVFTDTVPVNGNGSYQSAPFTPTAPGTYQWVAVYSGDANNAPATSPCGAPNEQSVVNPAPPTIVTVASPSVPVGGQVTDTATLAGGVNPTGSITFTLFGPDDATCAGTAIFTSTVPVAGNGDYTSAPFTVTAPGTYRWVAAYSGDANNAPATSPCNAPNESVEVTQAGPTIVTVASPATAVGSPITDTATLSGGVAPTGTITFTLFGPNDPTCAGPAIFTDTAAVNGNGDYTSDPFTVTAPGTYRWVAVYSGDANNAGATSPCNAPNETVTVGQAQLQIVTNVTPAAASVNQPVTDTATLSGGVNPTGTITFTAFGPDDANCTGAPVYTATVPVSGNGTYTATPAFVPTAPGTYRFVAAYSGDANNAAVTAICNAPNETVVVGQLPTIDIDKTAAPPSRVEPGGDFTFTVVVTNTSAVPLVITSLVDDIYGDLATRPEPNSCDDLIGDTLAPGASSDPCSFVGPFTGVAGASQTDTVTVVGTDAAGNTATASDDATVTLTPVAAFPQILVDKTVTPGSRPVPGGQFTFTVVVSNPGPIPVTITSLVDDVYGDLATRPDPNTCDDLIGDTLAPGASTAPCTFTASFTGSAGDTETDTVTVTGVDSQGRTVTDDDDATITLTPRTGPISIDVVKSASPASRPEPGGTFTFTVVVTNTSDVPLTITALTDDIYGNLATRGGQNTCDDLIGDVLQPDDSATCAFQGEFTGSGGDEQTDVVTVTGRDDQGRTVDDEDDATVRLTDVEPAIEVEKTAEPVQRTVPGGTFTFTVEVTNPSDEDLVLTDLVDDIYGDLDGRGTCETGIVIEPGDTYTCEFDVQFNANTPQSQTDIVTATGRDDSGNEVEDSDDATISLVAAPSAPPPAPPAPPAPPRPAPPPPPAPVPPVQRLVRTGGDFLKWFALSLALLSAGSVMRSRRPAGGGSRTGS